MRVLCIDDSGKPARITAENWIVAGQTYTVKTVERLGDGSIGYCLQEIEFPAYYVPAIGMLGSYKAQRFVTVTESPELVESDAAAITA